MTTPEDNSDLIDELINEGVLDTEKGVPHDWEVAWDRMPRRLLQCLLDAKREFDNLLDAQGDDVEQRSWWGIIK